ncbi:MAG: c-type cytochrome [Anaerolineales bacterium]|nr:c-type cytochrome [Anaerolineales bacterium]
MKSWSLIGLIATAIIALALPVYAFNETNRMETAKARLLAEAVTQGELVYAQNCVVCHGADGRGIGTYPGLDNEGVRAMDYEALFKTIERGRYGTAMAAWGVSEGGVLNSQQLDQLIAMIQSGDWTKTARTVDAAGLNPPTVLKVEIPAETLAEVAKLPHGQVLAEALPLYAANCSGCHGPSGEGTAIAPILNDATLRSQKSDEELNRIITNGVAGTLMAGWRQALSSQEIASLVGLLRNWEEIPPGLIPQPELPPIASSDAEIIAAGGELFSVACATCHGPAGQGTRMAPALNVQSFLTQTPDQAIKTIIAQGVPNTRMPAWGGRLTDAELNSLVSFLRAWEPTAPAVAQPLPGGGQGGGPPWLRNKTNN